MYQLVVQLKDLNKQGDQVIHEILSQHVASIQEAFETMDTGKQMFDVYLEIEKEVMKDINRVLNNDLQT